MRVRAQSTTAGASGCRVPTASVGCNSSSSPTPSSSWSPPACPRSWRPSPSSRPSSSSIVHVDANVGPLAGRFSFVFFLFFFYRGLAVIDARNSSAIYRLEIDQSKKKKQKTFDINVNRGPPFCSLYGVFQRFSVLSSCC